MTKIEMKILQLEREAAKQDAACRALRRSTLEEDHDLATRRGEMLANLLRAAADARQQAGDLRGRLPPGHALYREPLWQPVWWRTSSQGASGQGLARVRARG